MTKPARWREASIGSVIAREQHRRAGGRPWHAIWARRHRSTATRGDREQRAVTARRGTVIALKCKIDAVLPYLQNKARNKRNEK